MILIGLFYIVMVYAGTMGYGINNIASGYAGDSQRRLIPSANIMAPCFRVLIDVVGTVGFFSAALAIVNGGARVFFAVSRDGLLPLWLSWTHPLRQTPGAAIGVLCAFGLIAGIPLGLALSRLSTHSVFLPLQMPHWHSSYTFW